MSSTAPPDSKKPKLDVATIAWEHYRNFIDSQSDENQEGDADELVELLELVERDDSQKETTSSFDFESMDSLLLVLCSVAHCHLASNAIHQSLLDTEDNGSEQHDTVARHLLKSLEYFPQNAATWSMGSNYARMTQRASPQQVYAWYEKAAECASLLRATAIALLESDTVDNVVKEWIELLVLDGIVDCEYVGEEEEEEEENDKEDSSNERNDDDDTGYFSASQVEATSRFMAAMLLSTLGKHDQAKQQLTRFDLTHRLHPNVWTSTTTSTVSTSSSKPLLQEPFVFTQEALPRPLYDRLCKVLAPDASYWNESDYAHRGYYSYFFNIQPKTPPTNLIEDIVLHHLLPRAQHVLASTGNDDTIVGAEWWPHTRPIQANLGHQLHFDTDESLLAQEGKITHPILSSVLYLTTGNPLNSNSSLNNPAGATIVLDQTPDSTSVAETAWKSFARDNRFLVFPGNKLHGVLPCPGEKEKATNDIVATDSNVFTWNETNANDAKTPVNHRLTLMVGFWTRRVPDKMKERRLYGPCGPLPPATEEHSWVKEIQEGYPKATNDNVDALDAGKLDFMSLPKVSPAWEDITTKHDATDTADENGTNLPLELPGGIDHRFFVRGAPEFFRESLFHKD